MDLHVVRADSGIWRVSGPDCVPGGQHYRRNAGQEGGLLGVARGQSFGQEGGSRKFCVSARCLLFKGDRPITREKAYRDALAFKPGMLLIGLGTNDSKEVNWKHKTDFADNYKEVIAEFRKENPRLKVYCLLPIPSQEAREGGISRERISREVIPLIRQVAKSTNSKVIDLNKVMKDKEGLLVDGVHPNAEGHALMAEHILLVLKGKAAE